MGKDPWKGLGSSCIPYADEFIAETKQKKRIRDANLRFNKFYGDSPEQERQRQKFTKFDNIIVIFKFIVGKYP